MPYVYTTVQTISTDKQSIECAGIQHSFIILALNCIFNLLWIPVAM